jgi:hypothetical protein
LYSGRTLAQRAEHLWLWRQGRLARIRLYRDQNKNLSSAARAIAFPGQKSHSLPARSCAATIFICVHPWRDKANLFFLPSKKYFYFHFVRDRKLIYASHCVAANFVAMTA